MKRKKVTERVCWWVGEGHHHAHIWRRGGCGPWEKAGRRISQKESRENAKALRWEHAWSILSSQFARLTVNRLLTGLPAFALPLPTLFPLILQQLEWSFKNQPDYARPLLKILMGKLKLNSLQWPTGSTQILLLPPFPSKPNCPSPAIHHFRHTCSLLVL